MRAATAFGCAFGVLALWTGTGAAWAQTPAGPPALPVAPDPGAGAADGLALTQDPTSRLTLPVMIDGQGPFDFLVDTGSDRTVISRELAATLALPAGPEVKMQQSTGVDQVGTVVIDHLAVGERVTDHIEAPALAARDLGAAGILGIDALRGLHVVMDFRTMRMTSSPSRPEPVDPRTIVVRGRSRFGRLILANATIRGARVFVVLDSGAQLSVGNPALLRLLTGRSVRDHPTATAEITSVTGRRTTVALVDIAEARIGGIVIRNMPLAFAPLHIFERFDLIDEPALLLGMDVLRQCQRVSFDLPRREVTFTVN